MSKEWLETVALAEAAAEQKQAAEEVAVERFRAAKQRDEAKATETPEFHAWISARHATDEAWGRWAMAMDAKPATV
jgi:hypothetical protein